MLASLREGETTVGKKRHFKTTEVPLIVMSQGCQLVAMLHKVDADKIVVMCHGFGGNKIEDKRLFVEAARDFARHGYNALRFDFYGSGDSDGEFKDTLMSRHITNVHDVLAWVQDQGYCHVALLGISMGAAAAILAIQDKPVRALITWSAVPEMQRLYQQYVNTFGMGDENHQEINYKGWALKREFFRDALSCDIEDALARLKCAKFIVQGTADEPFFVEGFSRWREIVSPPADFMEVPGADHTFSSPAFRRHVIRQTTLWLQRHF